jgi:APA family basic amino acid/polyamine antiporter
LSELAELVKIATLFAFVLVAVGVLVLRRTRPDLKRAFVARAFRSYRCSPCST